MNTCMRALGATRASLDDFFPLALACILSGLVFCFCIGAWWALLQDDEEEVEGELKVEAPTKTLARLVSPIYWSDAADRSYQASPTRRMQSGVKVRRHSFTQSSDMLPALLPIRRSSSGNKLQLMKRTPSDSSPRSFTQHTLRAAGKTSPIAFTPKAASPVGGRPNAKVKTGPTSTSPKAMLPKAA